jgi:hypothetical protein
MIFSGGILVRSSPDYDFSDMSDDEGLTVTGPSTLITLRKTNKCTVSGLRFDIPI